MPLARTLLRIGHMMSFCRCRVLGFLAFVGATACSSDPDSLTNAKASADAAGAGGAPAATSTGGAPDATSAGGAPAATSAGGTAGANGTGGTAGATSAAIAPVCSSGACCIPLKVDPARARAYLVDGRLYFDAFASVVGGAQAGETYWSFDINLNSDVMSELTCEAKRSDYLAQVVSFNACSTTPLQPVACGDRIKVDVRLKSDTYDAQVQPLCTGEGLGPSTSVELDIECPVCPSQPEMGMECSFPRSGSCPATAYNHWQQRLDTVWCVCGNLLSIDEPRSWSCPVF